MILNGEGLFTLASTGVKHADTVRVLDFDGPKQTESNKNKHVHGNDSSSGLDRKLTYSLP